MWPKPILPGRSSKLYAAWTSSIFPTSFFRYRWLSEIVASPTESYPLYSSLFRASWTMGAALPSLSIQPNIPTSLCPLVFPVSLLFYSAVFLKSDCVVITFWVKRRLTVLPALEATIYFTEPSCSREYLVQCECMISGFCGPAIR